MKAYPNILLIAGTGRNTGKTTIACAIIKKFSKTQPVTGLKISPHFHGETEGLVNLYKGNDFNIYEEMSTSTRKDSSLMLKAGAVKVFYIETRDEQLKLAFETLMKIMDDDVPMVCESPGLGKLIDPGIFIIADNQKNKNQKPDILQLKAQADIWINDFELELGDLIERIQFSDSSWRLIQS
jgi:hypothetical protein